MEKTGLAVTSECVDVANIVEGAPRILRVVVILLRCIVLLLYISMDS